MRVRRVERSRADADLAARRVGGGDERRRRRVEVGGGGRVVGEHMLLKCGGRVTLVFRTRNWPMAILALPEQTIKITDRRTKR